MQPYQIAPILATLALFGAAASLGTRPIRKLIEMAEAHREFKRGSAGVLRRFRGWSFIALWLLVTFYLATILGDWFVTGDPGGALERSGRRLEVLLQIFALLAEMDS